jgi:Arm DNA-binding domain
VPILKLTKRVIDATAPVDKPTIFYDSELTGFCLKVLPSGTKRWCVEYRSGAGGRSVGKTRMVLTAFNLRRLPRPGTARVVADGEAAGQKFRSSDGNLEPKKDEIRWRSPGAA